MHKTLQPLGKSCKTYRSGSKPAPWQIDRQVLLNARVWDGAAPGCRSEILKIAPVLIASRAAGEGAGVDFHSRT